AFFAVPDKRYTFDIVRPLTTLADLLDCAHRELSAPSVGQIFDHLYTYRKVNTQDIWEGKEVDLSTPRMDIKKAVRTALSMAERYDGLDRVVVTSDSFRHVVSDVHAADWADWVVDACQGLLAGRNDG